MKKELSVKSAVAIGIGAAIFVILGRFASIPQEIDDNLRNIEKDNFFKSEDAFCDA